MNATTTTQINASTATTAKLAIHLTREGKKAIALDAKNSAGGFGGSHYQDGRANRFWAAAADQDFTPTGPITVRLGNRIGSVSPELSGDIRAAALFEIRLFRKAVCLRNAAKWVDKIEVLA